MLPLHKCFDLVPQVHRLARKEELGKEYFCELIPNGQENIKMPMEIMTETYIDLDGK